MYKLLYIGKNKYIIVYKLEEVMKKLLNPTCLLVMIISLSITACSNKNNGIENYQKKGTISVGTNAQFPPFEFYPNDKITGFDIELAQIIADKLNVKLVVEDMNFNSLIDAINKNKIDLIISAMTITPERQSKVNFSNPYYTSNQAIMVMDKNENIKAIEDLKSKKIGIQTGTTGEQIASKIEGVEIFKYNTALAAIMDMKSTNIDAIVYDLEACKKFKENNPSIKIIDAQFDKEQYGIAVRKDDTELLNLINEVLEEIKANGQYEQLIKKYFEQSSADS